MEVDKCRSLSEDEKCCAILSFTLRLCVVMPGASYEKCVDAGVRQFNDCTLRKLEKCMQESR
jgi:hypothetical protein